MKDLIISCTKNVHFTFDNDIYKQTDGVSMSSPLGPVVAGVIMVELENTMVPRLSNHLYFWRRYVDQSRQYVDE